jgi:hypothetical protein
MALLSWYTDTNRLLTTRLISEKLTHLIQNTVKLGTDEIEDNNWGKQNP